MADVEGFLRGIGFTCLEGLDEAAFWKLSYKHALVGPLHLQVMSPAEEDTGHKRFAARYGRRVFSIGFVVADAAALDAHEEKLKTQGLQESS